MKKLSKKYNMKLLEELRKRVIEKDRFLEEKRDKEEMLRASKEALIDMTDLSLEEINKIENEIEKDFRTQIKKREKWLWLLLSTIVIILIIAISVIASNNDVTNENDITNKDDTTSIQSIRTNTFVYNGGKFYKEKDSWKEENREGVIYDFVETKADDNFYYIEDEYRNIKIKIPRKDGWSYYKYSNDWDRLYYINVE